MNNQIPKHLQSEDDRNLFCLVLIASQCLERARDSQPEPFQRLNTQVSLYSDSNLIDALAALECAIQILCNCSNNE